mmetsp:Transcript_9571/g.21513  ORF Transcript_9571/g.21513 Transcript_9571/m.21513 type:complete len:281 (-) Transcript_9571:1924-2766(-)
MNPRQLSQGLVPAPEYERYHTYHSLRQFPELRRSVQDMQFINLRSKEGTNPQSHSQGLSRSITTRSTHMLSELTQSSVGDVSAMDDYRKILLENRKKMKNSASTLKPKAVKLAPIASTASEDDDSSLGFTTFLEKADKKLTKISISYDAQSYNSHLQGFSGALLAKEEFGTQLRRCLNINLKKKELSALFDKMDDDSSGLIDGVEFVRYFFCPGYAGSVEHADADGGNALAEAVRKSAEEGGRHTAHQGLGGFADLHLYTGGFSYRYAQTGGGCVQVGPL